jgi:hypothetical protein
MKNVTSQWEGGSKIKLGDEVSNATMIKKLKEFVLTFMGVN